MKVYACPAEIPPPVVDYRNFDLAKVEAAEDKHSKDLKEWLIKKGYTGKYTGEIIRFGVADGHAQYMMADGRQSFLIHLPYCDAYQYRDVEFLPKREIIRRIEAEKAFEKLWGERIAKKPLAPS